MNVVEKKKKKKDIYKVKKKKEYNEYLVRPDRGSETMDKQKEMQKEY